MIIIRSPMYGIKCCVTGGYGCDNCGYKGLGKPDCMQRLIDDIAENLKSQDEKIKELEQDLRRARWGTHHY